MLRIAVIIFLLSAFCYCELTSNVENVNDEIEEHLMGKSESEDAANSTDSGTSISTSTQKTTTLPMFATQTLLTQYIALKCLTEEKYLLANAIKFSKGDFSDKSENAKCFLKCFALKRGMIDENNAPVEDKSLEVIADKIKGNLEEAKEIFDACSCVERGEGNCDFAFNYSECFASKIKLLRSNFDWIFEDEDENDIDQDLLAAKMKYYGLNPN